MGISLDVLGSAPQKINNLQMRKLVAPTCSDNLALIRVRKTPWEQRIVTNATSLRDWHPRGRVAAAGASASDSTPTDLLLWLVSRGATPPRLKVARQYLGELLGHGLVATEHIEPGEVLLSVPITLAITSERAPEADWSAAVASRLLDIARGPRAADSAPWVATLPLHVPLPWLYWGDDEVDELQDAEVIEEIGALRDVLDRALEARLPFYYADASSKFPSISTRLLPIFLPSQRK
jgi:hypothetical protein